MPAYLLDFERQLVGLRFAYFWMPAYLLDLEGQSVVRLLRILQVRAADIVLLFRANFLMQCNVMCLKRSVHINLGPTGWALTDKADSVTCGDKAVVLMGGRILRMTFTSFRQQYVHIAAKEKGNRRYLVLHVRFHKFVDRQISVAIAFMHIY